MHTDADRVAQACRVDQPLVRRFGLATVRLAPLHETGSPQATTSTPTSDRPLNGDLPWLRHPGSRTLATRLGAEVDAKNSSAGGKDHASVRARGKEEASKSHAEVGSSCSGRRLLMQLAGQVRSDVATNKPIKDAIRLKRYEGLCTDFAHPYIAVEP